MVVCLFLPIYLVSLLAMSFSQFLFIALAGGVFSLAAAQFYTVYRNISYGRGSYDASEDTGTRLTNMLLIALGQRKMFTRPLAAVMHLFIYVGFVITQIELLEILVDGAFGTHRFFAPYLGSFYTVIIGFIEVLSVLILVAVAVFLARRYYLHIARFQKPELRGFPTIDAAVILILELILVACIFTMNTADLNLAARHEGLNAVAHPYGGFWVSQLFAGVWNGFSVPVVEFFASMGWWGHILIVFAYLLYLPYSKHLHIILAFFNTYYGKITPKGEIENMPAVQSEVRAMMADMTGETIENHEPLPDGFKFGASDVTDLSWKNLLDAYTCTECGRCTAVCPANITGKQLSPRKVMMDTRDRLEEVGRNIAWQNLDAIDTAHRKTDTVLTVANYNDGKNLFDRITLEEIRACTTCNACVEACPVSINPLDIIVQLRRYQVLDLANAPDAWNGMFTNIDNNRAPWQFSPEDRDKWATELV